MEIKDWINLARIVATTVDRDRVHISFIVKKKTRLLTIGTNAFKTHPLTHKYGYMMPYLHSELDAFRKLRHPQDKLTLLNFRFSKTGKLGMAQPCVYCLPWCTTVFDNIVYSNHLGEISESTRSSNWECLVGPNGTPQGC